ncbi:hypothetical protein HNP42_002504 [Bacillus velezensis]|nr:hypothetical protein [Bacillus velezensis]
MWISCEKDRKHSLSTCGQTVHGYEKVIHTFPDSSEGTLFKQFFYFFHLLLKLLVINQQF